MQDTTWVEQETKASRLEQENGRLQRKGVLDQISFLEDFR